ncbi:putative membrane protein [Anaplasma phagocytophilum str. CR1007]|nr:putative membrane protein [Anaplasma phagocytophilum str. CR1007]KKA00867.1 putative membrane protein [Anaplasma phagocytophilum str. CR1007]
MQQCTSMLLVLHIIIFFSVGCTRTAILCSSVCILLSCPIGKHYS